MRKLKIFILVIILAIGIRQEISANETGSDAAVDLREGRITYSISGESTTSKLELEILFNANNAVIREQYARRATRKYLYDKNSNEIMGLIDDVSWLGIQKQSYLIYYITICQSYWFNNSIWLINRFFPIKDKIANNYKDNNH